MKPNSRWILKRGKVVPHILEEDVVEEITTRLWLQHRIKVWRIRERIPGQGRLSTAGIPDLVGWLPGGIFLGIECKRQGGVHRVAQTQFIEGAKADGCIAFFAESWQDCVDNFRDFGIELEKKVA